MQDPPKQTIDTQSPLSDQTIVSAQSVPSSNLSSKIIIVAILVLLSLAIAFLFYQNWQLKQTVNRLYQSLASNPTPPQMVSLPTPDPTADWKTYTNSEIGISLKYPSDYKISEQKITTGISIQLKNKENTIYIGEGLFGSDNKPFNTEEIIIDGKKLNKYSYKYELNNTTESIEQIVVQLSEETPEFYIRTVSWYSQPPRRALSQKEIELFDQILSTFKFIEPLITPSPNTSNIKKLNYYLLEGWKTSTDSTDTFEMGYDPQKFRATPGNLAIMLGNISNPGSITMRILPYDGGSRHQFIYNELGFASAPPASEKAEYYHEVEYSYNGWRCLVIYGLYFSAKGATWGMCPISSSQAIFIEGPESESETESIIKTIKLGN